MTSLIEAARVRRANELADQRRAEDLAEADGRLWTVFASIKAPGRVFAILRRGRDEDEESFTSQHMDAAATVGPVFVIGDRQEAMVQALGLFRVSEITIRAVDTGELT